MRAFIFIVLLMSGCASVEQAPLIRETADVEIIGWRFDKEYFTNNTNCHQNYMAKNEEIIRHLTGIVSVSKKEWDNNHRQYACLTKGYIETSYGRCTYHIWEEGKSKLSCPERNDIYLMPVKK